MDFNAFTKRNLVLCIIFFLADFNSIHSSSSNVMQVLGFMQPTPFVNKSRNRNQDQTRVVVSKEQQSRTTSSRNMLPPIDEYPYHLQTIHHTHSYSSILLSDEADAAAAVAGANAALDGLRTFFAVITAIVFGFAGLTFVTAAFIVPQAAKQLEADTKRLRPGLWEEFEAKLEEGETMAVRPDLLQELGKIMQPVIIQAFEDGVNAKDAGVIDVGGTSSDTTKKTTNMADSDQWKD